MHRGSTRPFGPGGGSKKTEGGPERGQPPNRGGGDLGILGQGAGETTLLSILSTLLLPDGGEISILGMNGLRDGHRIRERVNISSGNAGELPLEPDR